MFPTVNTLPLRGETMFQTINALPPEGGAIFPTVNALPPRGGAVFPTINAIIYKKRGRPRVRFADIKNALRPVRSDGLAGRYRPI